MIGSDLIFRYEQLTILYQIAIGLSNYIPEYPDFFHYLLCSKLYWHNRCMPSHKYLSSLKNAYVCQFRNFVRQKFKLMNFSTESVVLTTILIWQFS